MSRSEQFQRLPEQLNKNGLPYTLINRNDVVALYGVGGTYYPDEFHYEVIIFQRVPEKVLFGKTMPARESLPSNEQFGKDGSKCFVDRESAERYYLELTMRLKTKSKVPEDHSLKKNSPQVGVDPTQTLRMTMVTRYKDRSG